MRIVINELGGLYIDASTVRGLRGLGLRLIDGAKRINIKVKLNLAALQLDVEKSPRQLLRS